MEGPLVSVVIPAFEAERFLAEAIESVLAQTYAPIETIVVDDGSSDGTAAVAARYPQVTLIRQANAGAAAARNRGFAAGKGELVAFHDADDEMIADKLEAQVGCLLADPAIELVFGEQELTVEAGAELPFWAEGSASQLPMPQRPAELAGEPLIHPMTMLMRRATFEKVGEFDPTMQPAEDLDWVFRASELEVGIARLPRVVLRRRVHAASLTQDAEASRAALFRAFKARIERHRARAS